MSDTQAAIEVLRNEITTQLGGITDEVSRLAAAGSATTELHNQLQAQEVALEERVNAIAVLLDNTARTNDTLGTDAEENKRNTNASLASQAAVQAATNATVTANRALQDVIESRTNMVSVSAAGNCEISGTLDVPVVVLDHQTLPFILVMKQVDVQPRTTS